MSLHTYWALETGIWIICCKFDKFTFNLNKFTKFLFNSLTKSGNLFHIDFGYILGRDPKPMPPPMKLCKEMVDAMGGVNSESYQVPAQYREQMHQP